MEPNYVGKAVALSTVLWTFENDVVVIRTSSSGSEATEIHLIETMSAFITNSSSLANDAVNDVGKM